MSTKSSSQYPATSNQREVFWVLGTGYWQLPFSVRAPAYSHGVNHPLGVIHKGEAKCGKS